MIRNLLSSNQRARCARVLAHSALAVVLATTLAGVAGAQQNPCANETDSIYETPDEERFGDIDDGLDQENGVAASPLFSLPEGWEAQNVYTLGTQAYVYGWPYLYDYYLRYYWTTNCDPDGSIPCAPVNEFWHARTLFTSENQSGGSPNNDTLYSVAHVDVETEPMILSHPGFEEDRYFSFEITAMSSDYFDYVSSRQTGSEAGAFMIVGPEWECTAEEKKRLRENRHRMAEEKKQGGKNVQVCLKGKTKNVPPETAEKLLGLGATLGPCDDEDCVPKGVKLLERSPTNTVLILGRTGVLNQKDAEDNVWGRQDQYKLTELSLWPNTDAEGPNPTPPLPSCDNVFMWPREKGQELCDWEDINAALDEFPVAEGEELMLKWFETIGVGRNQELSELSEEHQFTLAAAAQDGYCLLFDASVEQAGQGRVVNNWSISPANTGNAGESGDYLLRGGPQSMSGWIASGAQEGIYIVTTVDITGAEMRSNRNYEIRFEEGGDPPLAQGGFWSITMYDLTFNLVDNELDRYSIGNRNEIKENDDDGGLTIYVQNTNPGPDKESNWLPSKAGEDTVYLIFRIYAAGDDVLNGNWEPPVIVDVTDD